MLASPVSLRGDAVPVLALMGVRCVLGVLVPGLREEPLFCWIRGYIPSMYLIEPRARFAV